jgi:acetylornithine deacetylase
MPLDRLDPVVDLLRALVAIDSVNPSLVPGASGEAAIGRALAEHMRGQGLTVHIQEVAPGRPNVIGVLQGARPGPSLMYCGHIDTVGVAGMAQPFDPVERAGRLYGRGSQDMKSGVAAMVDAARVIAEGGGLDAGRLILACVVDEEHASIGADALVTEWRADAAVVTEPTDLEIAIAHKGFEWVEVETEGVAAHGSRPHDGRDAIRLMARVLAELDILDHTLQARSPHPLLGTASLHASLIHGGQELSSYPDRCRLQMERRTVPGEPPGCGAREVADILTRLAAADPGFKAASRPMFARPPYEIAADHPLVTTMQTALSVAPSPSASSAHLRPPSSAPSAAGLASASSASSAARVASASSASSAPSAAGLASASSASSAARVASASSAPSASSAARLASAPSAPSAAPTVAGMSFWTDASVLGEAGIPSLLFGPSGAGLHSVEEWVDLASVADCRDALVRLARLWAARR